MCSFLGIRTKMPLSPGTPGMFDRGHGVERSAVERFDGLDRGRDPGLTFDLTRASPRPRGRRRESNRLASSRIDEAVCRADRDGESQGNGEQPSWFQHGRGDLMQEISRGPGSRAVPVTALGRGTLGRDAQRTFARRRPISRSSSNARDVPDPFVVGHSRCRNIGEPGDRHNLAQRTQDTRARLRRIPSRTES